MHFDRKITLSRLAERLSNNPNRTPIGYDGYLMIDVIQTKKNCYERIHIEEIRLKVFTDKMARFRF